MITIVITTTAVVTVEAETNDDFLDLQRSRSVVTPNAQERGFGPQLIGRSVSGVRVTSVSSSTSAHTSRDSQPPAPSSAAILANSNAKLSELQRNNRLTVDDLNNPNFDEAIAAIIDENGGVHLNDGPGNIFQLVNQEPSGSDKEVNIFAGSELKQNQRRGLSNNHLNHISRTNGSIPQSTNHRGGSRFLPTPRTVSQHNPYIPNTSRDSNNVNVRYVDTSAQRSVATSNRSPRQRIHIIVNNRTQVQEIPIDDPIDFQRIPAIHQSLPPSPPANNRYSNPRPVPTAVDHNRRPITVSSGQRQQQQQNPRSIQTTTERPVRTTERAVRTHNSEVQYVSVNDRRQPTTNHRGFSQASADYGIQPEIVSARRETIPQRPPPVYRTPEPFSTAMACNQKACRLPDCFCSGSDIPAGLPVNQVPQIIMMTFDDAVNDINWHIYEDIFQPHRTNPNGCPIRATFYVSHEWTDYGQVQTLYSRGHEMASHSVTHSFGERFSKNQWNKEINGQREILHLYGGVNLEDIRGMRAPFLQGGGNKQFEMLYDANFTYDSTMPVFENNPPYWPFTLDFASSHECMIAPCPTKSFPGLWEIGMVMWHDLRGGRCSMGDACSNPTDENGVFEMIMKNFKRHYQSNRAPFGIYYHSAWFNTDHHKRGFIRVIDELLKYKDVYFMTKYQAIQWMRNPKPVHELHKSSAVQCGPQVLANRPPPCLQPNICNVDSKSGSRFLKTCQPCPKTYPWVGNTGFAKS
ncbi:uncharacterized protein LOC128955863 [Oppia nitens]|uniref:uncharacterized protein LOC128955863 n=1 Tax=Oppia nitens TaxID=1686743 RepID=UPI0023DA38D4|nr:uncharacterized protein LOC128955863 [Oppia nitens]